MQRLYSLDQDVRRATWEILIRHILVGNWLAHAQTQSVYFPIMVQSF